MALRSSVRAFTLGATVGSGLVAIYLLEDVRRAGDAVKATIETTRNELDTDFTVRNRELTALHDAFVGVPNLDTDVPLKQPN